MTLRPLIRKLSPIGAVTYAFDESGIVNTLPRRDIIDYEELAETFNQALIHTLRKHSIADTFLDYWVPDANPVIGITGMADSARIAGLSEIAICFRSTTVPEHRLPELETTVGCFARVSFTRDGDKIIMHASGMKANAGSGTTVKSKRTSKPSYWQARPDITTNPGTPAPGWDAGDIPEHADVHPHFRGALKAVLGTLTHEGTIATRDNVVVCGQERDITLSLAIDSATHVVVKARHTGAEKPSECAALDLFCRAAETLPIQEVADHVGLKVIESLVDPDVARPVGGVLLPVNAGAPFMLAPRLARRAYDEYRSARSVPPETNFYYPPPTPEWQALSSSEREERVQAKLSGFLQSEDLHQDDLELLRIEKNKYGYEVRVIIGFSERVKVADKPFLMRRLEQRLRRDVEPELELVADRARDKSPLRRLS